MPSSLAESVVPFLRALLTSVSRMASRLAPSCLSRESESCSASLVCHTVSMHAEGPSSCRIYQLRKTKTNIQILQQNVLLKQKYMVTFLRQHGPEVFHEMRSAYVETLSRVLSSHFRSYLAALERLQVSASCRSAAFPAVPSQPLIAASVHGVGASGRQAGTTNLCFASMLAQRCCCSCAGC